MVLDATERAMLESLIDVTIPIGAAVTRLMRNYSAAFLVSEQADFMVGLAVGYILSSYGSMMSTKRNRPMQGDDIQQAVEMIAKRSEEMRKAIFES